MPSVSRSLPSRNSWLTASGSRPPSINPHWSHNTHIPAAQTDPQAYLRMTLRRTTHYVQLGCAIYLTPWQLQYCQALSSCNLDAANLGKVEWYDHLVDAASHFIVTALSQLQKLWCRMERLWTLHLEAQRKAMENLHRDQANNRTRDLPNKKQNGYHYTVTFAHQLL